jgi:hypothetical protein
VVGEHVLDHGDWSYTTVIAVAVGPGGPADRRREPGDRLGAAGRGAGPDPAARLRGRLADAA